MQSIKIGLLLSAICSQLKKRGMSLVAGGSDVIVRAFEKDQGVIITVEESGSCIAAKDENHYPRNEKDPYVRFKRMGLLDETLTREVGTAIDQVLKDFPGYR